MRRYVIFLLLMRLFLLSLVGEVSDSAISNDLVYNSLLPPKPEPDLAVLATLDGTVHLVDTYSKKVLWSVSSGAPIYSSYQAFSNNDIGKHNSSELSKNLDEYVDVAEDWQLYIYSKRNGKLKKLTSSTEEYIKNTPFISEKGDITLGYKKTSVLVVDGKTGVIVRSCLSDDATEKEKNALLLVKDSYMDLGTVESLVYITRTDYVLRHYSPNSGVVLWSVAFADIEAEFRCQELKNSLGGISASAYAGMDDIKFPCAVKISALRIHDHSFLEHDKLGSAYPEYRGRVLPALPRPEAKNSENTSLAIIPHTAHSLEDMSLAIIPDTANSLENTSLAIIPDTAKSTTSPPVVATKSHLVLVITSILSIVGSVFFNYLTFRKWSNKPVEELKLQVGVPRKKKGKRSMNSRSKSNDESRPKYLSMENSTMENGGYSYIKDNEREWFMTFLDSVDGHVDGRKIGKLLVSNKEIAKGSNGTVVLEGIYDGRPVAVKRLVKSHHDVAVKEIQNLIASDQHPNIVRWFGVEHDQDFVYLALERCTCSLNDFIYENSESFQSRLLPQEVDSSFVPESTVRLHLTLDHNRNLELWKPNGHPSTQLLKLMRDMVSGLAHLHELGIIHRDLKPQNVLIINDKSFCAKLSDMGISKRLVGDMSSLTHHTTGHGSSGWRAPEQLIQGRQTRAVDLFSLGCVLFFCVTGGKHPFGENIERDVNILNDRKDLFLVENIPEAVDLFSRLLDPNPDKRPKVQEVLNHPFFWTHEKRLSFLQDISDRVELEDRENESELLDALESIGPIALNGKWDEKMEAAFINNIGRYRRYKYDSIRDLLRVIRNKSHHYRELPQEIKELLGSYPEGFQNYFSCRFPKLLIEVYKVTCRYCKEEEFFHKYIQTSIM